MPASADRRWVCGLVLVLAASAGCSHLADMNVAAITGDLDSLREHLRRGASVEARDEFGNTPLLWAVGSGNERAARFLLNRGADPNVRVLVTSGTLDGEETTEPGASALHLAASGDSVSVVELLLERGANVRAKADHAHSEARPLHWASNRAIAERLIAAGADPLVKNKLGETPLHCAAEDGSVEVIELLAEKKVPIDARDNYRQTPLMRAAGQGHSDAVAVLLKHGASSSATDQGGDMALHGAARELRYEAVRVLLEHGAPPNASGARGDTPLHLAAGGHEFGHMDSLPALDRPPDNTRGKLVRLLLAHGASVNARGGGRSSTPLHRAAYEGYTTAIRALIAGGADVNARTASWSPPGGLYSGQEETTPLHWAMHGDQTEAVRLLLAAGADANARDKRGTTPLELAGTEEIRKLLRKYGAGK